MNPRTKRTIQRLSRVTLNPVLCSFIRMGLPLPGMGRKKALVMETVGRKSAKLRRTPMGCLQVAPNRVLVVAERGRQADWVRNARAGGSVRIWFAGGRYRGTVSLLDEEDPEALLRRMGNPLHASTVRLLAHRPKVVAIDLSAEEGPGG
ncbi:MAG: nitroreductase family deazaflavin-dependent oxidoreductase [Actinomycetota bacterium]